MSNVLNNFSSLVVQHVIPKPCTAKYIAEVETWVKTKEVRSKEEVMLAEFGYADERAIPAVSLPLHRSLHCPVVRRDGGRGTLVSLVVVPTLECGLYCACECFQRHSQRGVHPAAWVPTALCWRRLGGERQNEQPGHGFRVLMSV